MPYPYKRGGLLDRWNPQGGPWALGDDMAAPTGQRWNPSAPYQGAPLASREPLGGATGEWNLDAFRNMGKPTKPVARPPQAAQPAALPIQMPVEQPLPDQMPSQDAAMAAYPDYQAGRLGGPQPQQLMQQYDASMAAHPDASMAAYPEQPQVQRQPQPGEQATGDNAQQGKLFGYDPQDWMSMGLAIMAGGANGGDWSMASQAMQGIQGRQREDKRLSVEDKRYDAQMARQTEQDAREVELHGLRMGELRYGEEQRARLAEGQKQAIAGATDPKIKAALEGMTPDQYGAFLGQRIISAEEEAMRIAAEGRERAFRAGQSALDRDATLNAAKFRNPSETARGRADLALMQPWQEAANLAQTMTLGRVQRMKEIITELAAANGINRPIGANDRIMLSRWGLSGDQNTQGLLQEYNQLLGQFTRDEAQKVKPVSNIDMEGIERQMANGDTEAGAAWRMLTRMEDEMVQGIDRTNKMVNWVDSGNSFSGLNDEGKSFYEVHGYQSPTAPSASPAASSAAASGSGAKSWPSPNTNALTLLGQNMQNPQAIADFKAKFGEDNYKAALAKIKQQPARTVRGVQYGAPKGEPTRTVRGIPYYD